MGREGLGTAAGTGGRTQTAAGTGGAIRGEGLTMAETAGTGAAGMGAGTIAGTAPPGYGGIRFTGLVALACAGAGVVLLNAVSGGSAYRWWANFILVPGALLMAAGIALTGAHIAARYIVSWVGLIIFGTGALLILHAMTRGWPLMIVMPCLGLALLLQWRSDDPGVRAAVWTVGGLAFLGTVLGLTLLAMRIGLLDFGESRWWVAFMAAAALVPLGGGALVLRARRGEYWFSIAVLLVATGAGGLLAALRELLR